MALTQQQIDLLTPVLEIYGESAIQEMVAILMQSNKYATGTLVSSFRSDVIKTMGNLLKLQISFEDYGRYVQYGRRPGTYPPIKPLIAWARTKVKPQGYSDIQFAFAVQKNIFKYGITATDFYSAFYKNIVELQEDILQVFGQAVLDDMKAAIEGEKITFTGKK